MRRFPIFAIVALLASCASSSVLSPRAELTALRGTVRTYCASDGGFASPDRCADVDGALSAAQDAVVAYEAGKVSEAAARDAVRKVRKVLER